MVSRRNFFSILLMMVMLLFMFQFSQVVKEVGNDYDYNEFTAQEPASGRHRWGEDAPIGESGGKEEGEKSGGRVLFWGDGGDELGRTIDSWCTYSKRKLEAGQDIGAFDADGPWELILIDSASVDFGEETERILQLTEWGAPLVFCNLPEASAIREDRRLAQLLGISEVRGERAQIEGLHLFPGFLLGGEAIYQAQRPEEEKLQDFDLTVPWYVTGKGTKTYMVGIMEEEQAEREEFPALIWRNTYEDIFVFSVNGDYMSGPAGLGILDAMLYEARPYVVYPVVNAQNAAALDFPYLAPENAAGMEELYSRTPETALRDVFWAGMVSLAMNSGLKLTCLVGTKYDYTDAAQPSGEELPFYLRQMKEIDAEAGKSLNYGEGTTLEGKVREDGAFYASTGSAYRFGAAYFESVPEALGELLTQENGLDGIRTIVCPQTGERPLLSYMSDSVTLQGSTGIAGEYTYSSDLKLKGTVTALGYSNLLIDLHVLRWPESDEDRWERYSDETFSEIATYWNGFHVFEHTTLSESDARVRTFLNLDYREKAQDGRIWLDVENGGGDAWFILRCHGEEIAQIEGGEEEEIEKGAYLIHALSDRVEIRLETGEDILRYTGPFAQRTLRAG